MLHAFNKQKQAGSSSTTTSHTPPITQAILSKEHTLFRSIVPAIMHMITQDFEPEPGLVKNLIALFFDSIYIVHFLEKKTQAGKEIFSEESLAASNIQHSLTTWHFFTKLFEKYRQTEHYQSSSAQTRANQLFDYFKGSILLSLKYNTDTNYWTKDFILFNYWIFNSKKTLFLEKTYVKLKSLLDTYRLVEHSFPREHKYAQRIYDDILKLSRLFNQWDNLSSLIKIQFIEDIYQDCLSIQESMHKLLLKQLIEPDSVSTFNDNLSILCNHVDDMLFTQGSEQKNINQIERSCLLEMDWKLSELDMCSAAVKYELILNIEKNRLNYINTKLEPEQRVLSFQQKVATESSEEQPDDMSLEGASKTKRRGHAI